MANRNRRAQIARETLDIVKAGAYKLADGSTVPLADSVQRAREGTTLYTPESFEQMLEDLGPTRREFCTEFEVVNCTTLSAVRRLVEHGESSDPACLNFASAKNPGGGFLGGSQAQEESLARASSLYACIAPVHGYYNPNRNCGTCLYTHHMIYSPKVPVFRDDDDQLLHSPYLASIITAPAVNAGAVRVNTPQALPDIETKMLERIERVLALALFHGHDTIVLGAWGCGVFQNSPADVAKLFHERLCRDGRFRQAFRKVVFAVLDRSNGQKFIRHFIELFGDADDGV